MSLLYVTEYAGVGFSQIGGLYAAVPIEPPLARQRYIGLTLAVFGKIGNV